MKRSAARKNNKINKKQMWIYIRYIIPIAVVLLTVISLFIPCFIYTTVQGVDDDVYSLAGVISEYWQPICNYAFYSIGDLDPAILKFSQTLIASVVVCSVMFVIGTASTVYVAINAFRYFKNNDDKKNSRMLFLTLIPNRIAEWVWMLPCVPLLLLPRYLIYLFEHVLGEQATLTLTFPEPIMVFGVLYVALAVVFAMSVSVEKAQGMNPFSRKMIDIEEEDDEYDDED